MATLLETASDEKLGKVRWYERVQDVLLLHNSRRASGTGFRRNEVNSENYLEYLDQKLNKDNSKDFDSTLTFNSLRVDYRDCTELLKQLFKFRPGSIVLLSKKSLKPGAVFTKMSKTGAWGREKHEISNAQLRTTSAGAYVQGVLLGLVISVFLVNFFLF